MHTSSGYDLQSASFAAIESKPSAGVASKICSDVAVYWDNIQPECLRKLYRGSTETPMGLAGDLLLQLPARAAQARCERHAAAHGAPRALHRRGAAAARRFRRQVWRKPARLVASCGPQWIGCARSFLFLAMDHGTHGACCVIACPGTGACEWWPRSMIPHMAHHAAARARAPATTAVAAGRQ